MELPYPSCSMIPQVGRPARVRFVSVLPKTRSGKLLRRAIQAVCEGRDPGDLTTMDVINSLKEQNVQVAAGAIGLDCATFEGLEPVRPDRSA